MSSQDTIRKILDLARWAPSGDNTQPWRFELVDSQHFIIHGHDTRGDTVYDLDGRASQLSLGALIETAAIAASGHGLALVAKRREGMPETQPTFDVELTPNAGDPSPLINAIQMRSVQRRPLSTRRLTANEKRELEAAVGPQHQVLWFEGLSERWQWTKLLWANAGLRLRLPEAFEVHRRVIQWDSRFSPDRIPDQALGVDALTIAMMRQAMTSWERIQFMNKWLAGTIAPRLLMDLLPAMACAAHIAILARQPDEGSNGQIAAGRAVQRFWLTAARLGLQHQPAMTPLIFSRFIRDQRAFTSDPACKIVAQQLASAFDERLAGRSSSAVWLGRIGAGSPAQARSLRRPLSELMATSRAG
jgi:nitroreductase